MNENFVTPGNENSGLLALLRGGAVPLMPPDAPLPQADVELIEEWIVLGADAQ